MSLISKRKDSVAVVGVGNTPYGALHGHDATTLGIWALRNAAEDAGIELQDIDGLICQRLTDYQKFVQITNTTPKLVTALPGAGRMTGGTIQIAVKQFCRACLTPWPWSMAMMAKQLARVTAAKVTITAQARTKCGSLTA